MRNKIITVYEVILPCVRDEVLREFLSLNKIKAKNNMRDITGLVTEFSTKPQLHQGHKKLLSYAW